MEGRDLSKLFAICGTCHLAATFTVTGARRPASEVLEMAAALNEPAPRIVKAKRVGKPKTRRPKLDIEGIRALSQRYAEGRMR